jgi:hypothetical protein
MLQHRGLEVYMDLGYDIFRTLEDGAALWIKQVATLDDGKKHLVDLVGAAPAEYFIRDASTGEIVFRSDAIPPA